MALAVSLAAWMFANALFLDDVFAYRDTAYLYQPLYRFVESQWSAGRLPLWNPLENCGTPLAANPIAAVFYPGKLLFRLPIGFDAAFRFYVVLHVLLAAAMSYLLARRWRCSIPAAGLAAISYAFGGCVLFQYCNVIYLVSAAWLPAVLAAADRAFAERCSRATIACGAALALMILGGDPQTAYHALLLIALYGYLQWRTDRTAGTPSEAGRSRRWYMIAAATFLLAAVQILPAMELARRSERAAYETPRNVWELCATLVTDRASSRDAATDWSAGLRAISSGLASHDAGTYQFSLSPWRVAEVFWPNVSGRSFPINRRWLTALPAEGRVWVPSLYLGTIPLVLAILAFGVRRAPLPARWMSWCVVIGLVASLGAYGPGWIGSEISRSISGDSDTAFPVGGGFGGLYWLFNVVLPGYAQFRYPAKWLVVAALGGSQLAAFGFDAVLRGECRCGARLLAMFGVTSLVGLIAAVAIGPWWAAWLEQAPADSLFGPLDAAGAWRDLAGAFLHTTIIAGACYFLLRRNMLASQYHLACVLLLITGVDLAVANRWLVLTAPADIARTSSTMLAESKLQGDAESSPWHQRRAYRAPYWQPRRFEETSDPRRAEQSVVWDRDSLWPRYNLEESVGLVAVMGTLTTLDYATLVPRMHREARDAREAIATTTPTPALDLVGAEWLILPRDPDRDATLRGHDAPHPRAWIAGEVVIVPSIDEYDIVAVRERTDDVLRRLTDRAGESNLAIVETDRPVQERSGDPSESTATHATAHCELVRDGADVLEIDVSVARRSLLVLAEAYDPNWITTLESTGETLHIERVNRVLRGVWLPAGDHRIAFRYRPTWLYVGVVISAAAWTAAVAAVVLTLKCRAGSRHGAGLQRDRSSIPAPPNLHC